MNPPGPLPQIALPPGSLCIADLHLDVWTDEPPRAFLDWLGGLRGVPALAILGDLFDAWVGPAHAGLASARAVAEALAALNARGTAVDVVPGNRDFLLGPDFERLSGARIRPRGLIGRAGAAPGELLLLIHGDELCTADRAYQRLRRVLRSGAARRLASALPRGVALAAARKLRRASAGALEAKPAELVAQDPAACRALAEAHGAGIVVAGHAHRFRDERLPGGPRWIVLDAFGGPRDVLEIGALGALEVRSSRSAT